MEPFINQTLFIWRESSSKMKRLLNICLINTYDIAGGAAIAAHRLHKGLILQNNNSVMVVRKKMSNDTNVLEADTVGSENKIEEAIFAAVQKELINLNRTNTSDTLFSWPYPGYDLSKTQPVRNADIINLHWINNFQSVESIASLLSLRKPVVWTLHDQWAFTGGCHYSAGCEKYTQQCRQCPQLLDDSYQLPELVLQNKLNYFSNSIVIVSPSNWLAECARKSALFKDCRIEVIPNGLDLDIFKPVDKAQAKRDLNINPETATILFGAMSHAKKRKGFKQLCKAIDFCLKNKKFIELIRSKKAKIITVGTTNSPIRLAGIPTISFGSVNSEEKLALIYSAADFLVLPSLEENLSNIMLECLSCGTPVIAFKTGGMSDAIRHGQTGYLATNFNTDEMGSCILDLIFKPEIRKKMSSNARDLARKNFSAEMQANRYLKLYHDLLRRNTSSESNSSPTGHKECRPTLSPIDPVFSVIYEQFKHRVSKKSNRTSSSDTGSLLKIASTGGRTAKKVGKSIKRWIKHTF